MFFQTFIPVTGIIQNIVNMRDCCSFMVSVLTSDGDTVNFMMNADTVIIDNRRLETGMRITAFYDAARPVVLIYPPQYQAEVIAVLDGDAESVAFEYFNRNLVASDNSLRVLVGEGTVVETVNGQPFTCNPANHMLLVFYTVTTRSIPPQTTPERIVVFC